MMTDYTRHFIVLDEKAARVAALVVTYLFQELEELMTDVNIYRWPKIKGGRGFMGGNAYTIQEMVWFIDDILYSIPEAKAHVWIDYNRYSKVIEYYAGATSNGYRHNWE